MKRIGVLGAGQLALMLAEAAKTLGVEVVCAGSPDECAARVAHIVPVDLSSAAEVAAFAASVDAVTLETENIDAEVLRGIDVFPNAHAVGIAQDRLLEKQFFESCGVRVAPYAAVDSLLELERALVRLGTPAILKTRRMGYDGRGQVRLMHASEAAAAWEEVGSVPCVLEATVQFSAEVSLLAARSRAGEVAWYPLAENLHAQGILRVSRVPSAYTALQWLAQQRMQRVLEALEYVGVLAIEFFVVDGQLMANEMAPRVHNSGHWTIEGAATSQFANHLRAISGLPLGPTTWQPTVMLNCIGSMPVAAETASFATLHRHDYGKEPRAARKVGHLTFPAGDAVSIAEWQRRLAEG
jgi:5-(carboxyamino)imidazole ribonucleotide synthase